MGFITVVITVLDVGIVLAIAFVILFLRFNYTIDYLSPDTHGIRTPFEIFLLQQQCLYTCDYESHIYILYISFAMLLIRGL